VNRDQQVQRQQAGELGQQRDDGGELHPEEVEVVSHREIQQLVTMKTVSGAGQEVEHQ
jgi:hypothetical protein